MKPKYQVGDQVLIKSKYDPGKTEGDYAANFNSNMLSQYGGTLQIIEQVYYSNRGNYYYFYLKDCIWIWSEDMFDPITNELWYLNLVI